MNVASFASVSAITQTAPGHFSAEISPDWTIGGKPNGGYLLALLGRAATASAEHGDVLAASAHYLRAPEPGPATVQTQLLRGGRTASQVRAQLIQGDRACVEALLTLGSLSSTATPYWSGGLPERSPAERADGIRVPGVSPVGLRVTIMDQVDLRLEPATASFGLGAPTGAGVLRGWLELPGGEPFDSISLLYALDALPPATFDIEPTGWVPTLELTAYVRAQPAPGPIQLLQRALLIDDQRVDEVCFAWDSTGRLVGQATQLAGIRLG